MNPSHLTTDPDHLRRNKSFEFRDLGSARAQLKVVEECLRVIDGSTYTLPFRMLRGSPAMLDAEQRVLHVFRSVNTEQVSQSTFSFFFILIVVLISVLKDTNP